MRTFRNRLVVHRVAMLAGAAACCGALATPSVAQDASQPASRPSTNRGEGLDEIIVTARKRVESAQDIPVSVTALSQERIEQYDLTSLEKVAAFTPQFNVGRASNGSGAQITLRGIGSQATSIGVEQSTAIVVDGVYYGQGRVINEAFFDLERVELLKGPQALFFGKNATAGVVSIKTADPTDKLEILARAGYEFKSQNVVGEGVISGPIAPNLNGRLAVRLSNMFAGYFTNNAVGLPTSTFDIATGNLNTQFQPKHDGGLPGTNEKLVRGTLQWKPNSDLTATLKAGYLRTEDEANAWNYVPFACPLGTAQPNPSIVCRRDFVVYIVKAPDDIAGTLPFMRPDGGPFNLYRSATVTGTVEYALPNVTISSVTNYNWNRNIWGLGQNVPSTTSFVAATENTSFWAFSNETRVQTDFDGPVNLLLGTYYQKSKRDYKQRGAFAPLEDSSQPLDRRYATYFKDSQTDGETLSAFGQAAWNIVPQLELAAGVRYTHETKDSFLNQPYINAALQGLFLQFDPTVPNSEVRANQEFNDWSPEVTLTYKPTDDITIYGAYKTAYKSGGFSNSAFVTALTIPSDIAFQPEKARGFEGGIKTTLLDDQLRFNIGVYSYKYKNLQVDYFNSITFQFITTNAGSATTRGAELELQFAPRSLPGFNARAGLNYNKARYENYIAPCYGGQTIQAGCSTVFQAGPGQDLSGFPTALAPKWTGNLGLDYDSDLGSNFVFGTSVNARYSSDYLASSFGHPLSLQNQYINLDATVRVGTADKRWEFALIGRNLTNHFHISGVLDQPSSGSGTGTPVGISADQVGLVDLPRTVRAQVTFRY